MHKILFIKLNIIQNKTKQTCLCVCNLMQRKNHIYVISPKDVCLVLADSNSINDNTSKKRVSNLKHKYGKLDNNKVFLIKTK